MPEVIRLISEDWFLQEPAFFALYCQQQLTENASMQCPVRCGQGRIEYNPLLLAHRSYHDVEQLMRIEMIRLFLKHPYEREPEGCSREAMAIGSDITIADGYCVLHHDKLPLRDPGYYHLPLGQYYEWYAKAIQKQQPSDPNDSRQQAAGTQQRQPSDDGAAGNDAPSSGNAADADRSKLWRFSSLEREKIDELIRRTTDWGTLPSSLVERIQAGTHAHIDRRLVWQGFQSAILSSHRQLTRMRPNRRTGFLQMGSTRQFDTRLLIAIDTSGSITAEALSQFYASINNLFRYGIVEIDVCQFDAALGPITPFRRAQPEVTVTGRGGTSYQPLFDYVMSHPNDYDGLLILTDGQAPPPVLHSTVSASLSAAHQAANAAAAVSQHLPLPVLWVCQDRASYQASAAWMQRLGRCTYLV